MESQDEQRLRKDSNMAEVVFQTVRTYKTFVAAEQLIYGLMGNNPIMNLHNLGNYSNGGSCLWSLKKMVCDNVNQ